MKIGAQYSHLNGFEWIQYHQKDMWDEMVGIIANINAEDFRTKISKSHQVLFLLRCTAEKIMTERCNVQIFFIVQRKTNGDLCNTAYFT